MSLVYYFFSGLCDLFGFVTRTYLTWWQFVSVWQKTESVLSLSWCICNVWTIRSLCTIFMLHCAVLIYYCIVLYKIVQNTAPSATVTQKHNCNIILLIEFQNTFTVW